MPCQGPGEPSPERVEQITDEVLQYLADKHSILIMPPMFAMPEQRKKAKQKLSEAIREILFVDDCEGF